MDSLLCNEIVLYMMQGSKTLGKAHLLFGVPHKLMKISISFNSVGLLRLVAKGSQANAVFG